MQVSKIVARGGGDAPEDVVFALEQVKRLGFNHKTKMVIHIADSACHGTR